MTVKVQLVEASQGRVTNITQLCKITGKIPVYAGYRGASSHGGAIHGCEMLWKGKNLNVTVRGGAAISRPAGTYAFAYVGVIPPDAKPLCPDVCGPQPLADSRGEIKVSGAPHSLKFALVPNPVSMLNANPTVWLEADVEVAD